MKAVQSFGAPRAASATVRSRPWLVLGAGMLMAACASKPVTETPQAAQTSAATAQQLVAADVDVVCRDTMVTGSHFPKRVCRTKKEWGQIEENSRSFAQGVQSDSTRNLAPVPAGGIVNPTPIGGPPVY
jgi:hypothetical protein